MLATLEKLANKHKTDKGYKHGYIGTYDKYFNNIRDKEIDLLELGISQGSSLLMWKEYFSKGNIIGMDIFEGDHYEGKVDKIKKTLRDNGIGFISGSQTDLETINAAVDMVNNKGFDIVIDDASHRPYDQQVSMYLLFPHLREDGYYIIEDLDYRCDPKESTLSVIKQFKKTGQWKSSFLTDAQNEIISETIKEIKLYRNDKIAFFTQNEH